MALLNAHTNREVYMNWRQEAEDQGLLPSTGAISELLQEMTFDACPPPPRYVADRDWYL